MAVTITNLPSGATLSGPIAVAATFSGQNFEIATVTLDGQQLGSDSALPIVLFVDTTKVPSGTHTLTVAVRYQTSAGTRRWQKTSIPVTVDNEGAEMRATLTTSQESPLSGTVTVTATGTPLSQASTITRVEFFVDGVLRSTDTSSPHTFSWDTTAVSEGYHQLRAMAYYPRNKAAGAVLDVTVQNVVEPSPPPPPPSPAIAQDVPVNTAVPTISDTTPQEGQTISASDGSWTNSPTSYSRQWVRCDGSGANCVAIASATGATYTCTAADVSSTLRCAVTAHNSIGASAPATTAQTSAVSALASSVPVLVTLPIVTGSPVQGVTLTSSNGAWTNSPTSYTYEWRRCDVDVQIPCVAIGGATASTYTAVEADVGKTIRCAVRAINGSGSSTDGLSAPTAAVTSSPPAPVPPGNALLYTGWGSPVWMDAISETPARDQTLYLHGVDPVTGFDLDAARFYGDRWRTTGIIGNPSGSTSSYFNNRFETVTGPGGGSTRALRLDLVSNPVPNGGAPWAQCMIETSSLTSAVKDYYLRMWIKLDPDVQTKATAAGTGYWRMFWEYKTWSDYRMKVYIMNHHPPGPHWRIEADNGGWQMQGNPTLFWEHDQNQKVPLNQWFHVEIYHYRSTGSDGRFFMAVNGAVIVDRMGANYGANNDEIAIMAHSAIYGAPAIIQPAWQWIDTFEVRNLPPGTLPSASPPSL